MVHTKSFKNREFGGSQYSLKVLVLNGFKQKTIKLNLITLLKWNELNATIDL